jgi:uncharacterized membrane protein
VIALLLFLFAVIFVLLLVFMARVSEHSAKIRALQSDIQMLHRRISDIALPRPPAQAAPYVPPQMPAQHPVPPESPQPSTAETLTEEMLRIEREAAAHRMPLEPPPPPPIRTPSAPSRTNAEWEALIGGKLLNRVGALALIIGVGFFLKYAFDRNLISETVRVLIGVVAGAGLLTAGHVFSRKGLAIFAQGLVGAGISILYLSVYASFNYYHLVSQIVAFVLMAIVTTAALTEGIIFNGIAIALLGWAGGFLTPIMLSTGSSNEMGLMTYTAILDAGLLSIVVRKPDWRVLQSLTLGGTLLLSIAWGLEHYTVDDFGLTIFFTFLFWALFAAADIVLLLRAEPNQRIHAFIVSAAVALFAGVILVAVLDGHHNQWKGLVVLALALAYAAGCIFVFDRHRDLRHEWSWLLVLCVALLAFAVSEQFEKEWIVTGWSVLLACAFLTARRTDALYLNGILPFAAVVPLGYLLILTVERLSFSSSEPMRPFLNSMTVAYAALAGSFIVSAKALELRQGQNDRFFRTAFLYFWPMIVMALFSVETVETLRRINPGSGNSEYLTFLEFVWLGLLWAVGGGAFAFIGVRTATVEHQRVGLASIILGIFVIALRGLAFSPIGEYTPLFNIRLAAILVISATALLAFKFTRDSGARKDDVQLMGSMTGVGAILLFLVLATGETLDIFALWMKEAVDLHGYSADLSNLRNMQQLSLSGAWLLYSIIVMILGIARRSRPVRIIAILVFGVTILKIFFYDLSFLETFYRIFSFIGLGVILLAVSFVYQRNKALILGLSEEAENSRT